MMKDSAGIAVCGEGFLLQSLLLFLEKGALICGRSPHIPLHFVSLVRSLRGPVQTAPFHGERLCRFCVMQNSYADSTLTQRAVLQTAIEKSSLSKGGIGYGNVPLFYQNHFKSKWAVCCCKCCISFRGKVIQ